VDLNPILWNMERFLKRVIGEDIQIIISPADETLTISADSGQIQQVMMNLATNARDAMPDGGTFRMTLQRYNLEANFVQTNGFGIPGQYALLSVSDTGGGMDIATRERLFEPFFTTKDIGKGTGLGLSIVYGIIKQHNGYITVDSEPGNGTVFRIYFPLHLQVVDHDERTHHIIPQKGNETILVVEDDADVRGVVVSTLEHFDYKVILAHDGLMAVDIFKEKRDKIQLVLMDIVMPNLNGKEAAQKIRLIQPDVRILFTSGYAADIINNHRKLDDGEELIMKPVNSLELLGKIREALDRQPSHMQ
jgi:CheY-like chemotaxis protein